jgi:hypothetical protein
VVTPGAYGFPVELSRRALTRTLLLRQHLLARTSVPALSMVEHLVGLQAQDNLPPYLSLAARIEGFDPRELSSAIEERAAVRFFTMRGTVHVLTADDALVLRPWVQPFLDRVNARSQISAPSHHVPTPEFRAAVAEVLTDGPLPFAVLCAALLERFPDATAEALGHRARERMPMVQVPPRGLWRRSGGVVYALADRWLGRPLSEPDLPVLVRRYLAAYGPATAADMTTWSGVTHLGPVFTELAPTLETHTDEAGKVLYDVPGAPLADPDEPAPARLLGKYDNVWLSHAARDRVASKENRQRWMGRNGGVGNVVLVDGEMQGIWTLADGRISIDAWRRYTRAEQAEVDAEVARVEELLAVPPG